MADNYALVEEGVVINMALWDGASEWEPPAGKPVLATEGVSIGWLYDGEGFSAPPAPEKTQEELIAEAGQTREGLISQATSAIVVWQTKLLRGRKLTDAEGAELDSWLDYIDELEAIDTSDAPDITWPAIPSN